jgi:PA14 domain
MFSQLLTIISPMWLIAAVFILLSAVFKNRIVQLFQILNLSKLLVIGFSFALMLAVLLTGNGVSALQSLAYSPEINKADAKMENDKALKLFEEIKAKNANAQSSSSVIANSSSVENSSLQSDSQTSSVAVATSSLQSNPMSSSVQSSSLSSIVSSNIAKADKPELIENKTEQVDGDVKVTFTAGTEVSFDDSKKSETNTQTRENEKQTKKEIIEKAEKNETKIVDENEIVKNEKSDSKLAEFELGFTDEHLIFSKPVKVEVAVKTDATDVEIKAKHFGDVDFSASGLGLSESDCTNSGAVLLAPVIESKVTFYTCGASTFTITPSAGALTITSPSTGATVTPYPTFVGTGSVNGATVNLTLDGPNTNLGSTIVSGGTWSITSSAALPAGSNIICIASGSCVTVNVVVPKVPGGVYASPLVNGVSFTRYSGFDSDLSNGITGTLMETGYTNSISSVGFATVDQADSFSVEMKSKLLVTTAGTYQFQISHDDTGYLAIDGVQYYNGTSVSTTSGVNIALSAGYHTIVVRMSENTGAESIVVNWRGVTVGLDVGT